MIFARFQIHVILFLILIPQTLFAKKNKIPVEQVCLNIHNHWLKETFELTKNSVGFSAPVSARAYSYVTIGMYESTVELLPVLQSLSGQLNGYSRTQWKPNVGELNWALISNSVDASLLNYFYRSMPPSNSQRVKYLHDSIQKKFSRHFDKSINQLSIEYGQRIANEIIEWSKLDGGDEAFNNNYSSTFIPPSCASCWTKTTPGYFSSLLPYWGNNRTFLLNSYKVVDGCEPMPFSTDSTSILFTDAKNLLGIAKTEDPKYEKIAEYWDDSPGYSGTPSGHLFMLARDLAIRSNLSADKSMELYVKLGVSLNDAFIVCWKLKYTYNFIRPITYIHRYIDPQYNTFIASPSFPEFPSGHSFQSGAGTEIMKSFFLNNLAFVDSTNIKRIDIDGAPREFSSFDSLAEEISISRYYGGIHFLNTLETSLEYGQKIGQYVANELKCRK